MIWKILDSKTLMWFVIGTFSAAFLLATGIAISQGFYLPKVCHDAGYDYYDYEGEAAPGYASCCNKVYVDNLAVEPECTAVKAWGD